MGKIRSFKIIQQFIGYKLMIDFKINDIFKLYQSPIAIVCNDAGAANIILFWIKSLVNIDLKLHLTGPAKKIFEKEFYNFPNLSLEESIEQSNTLISGTGWSSTLEHDARKIAKKKGIHSIAVIDHWVNYKERFFFDNKEILPNEIWVTDIHSFDIASKVFKNIKLRQLSNLYLAEQVKKIKKFKKHKNKVHNNVLYALEPIRKKWKGESKLPGEIQALNFFIQNLHVLGLDKNSKIQLRPHPSEPREKYEKWCANQKDFNIEISLPSEELYEAIAKSEWVVGCDTYVLVIALMAKRKVASTLPINGPECLLPHKEIIKMKKMILI